jgi:hypothetical protein
LGRDVASEGKQNGNRNGFGHSRRLGLVGDMSGLPQILLQNSH